MKNRNFIFITILLALGCFALCPRAQAVTPAPDGGYANGNTAEGQNALFSLTTGVYNTATGFEALYGNTTGQANTANGYAALHHNTTGYYNTATGFDALYGNTTGHDNTATGDGALYHNTTGYYNTATGGGALQSNTTGHYNTANGAAALYYNTTGYSNTATGDGALATNTTGIDNTANGFEALYYNTTGYSNTADGQGALYHNTTGSRNIALGVDAGFNVTTAHDVICIGTDGYNVDNACYIGNIFNSTSSGGIAVFINSNGRLGTATSSRRFKEEIKPMDKASKALFALKPVAFRYKKDIDPAGTAQLGLVAEEVEKVNPDLVVRDKEGKPYSVRYDQVNAMLLNEFLKEHKAFLEEQRKVQEQDATIARLKSRIAKQEKGIEALVAHVRDQDSKIQRVSDQLELRKPAPRVVVNKP